MYKEIHNNIRYETKIDLNLCDYITLFHHVSAVYDKSFSLNSELLRTEWDWTVAQDELPENPWRQSVNETGERTDGHHAVTSLAERTKKIVCYIKYGPVLRFGRLVVGLSQRRSLFNPWPVNVGFMVDQVALREYFGFPRQYHSSSVPLYHLPPTIHNLRNLQWC